MKLGLNSKEIDKLKSFLNFLKKPSGSYSLTHNGMISNSYDFNALNSSSLFWILNSKATNHMTNLANIFQIYKLCSNNRKVKIANISLTIVSGQKNISVSSN